MSYQQQSERYNIVCIAHQWHQFSNSLEIQVTSTGPPWIHSSMKLVIKCM